MVCSHKSRVTLPASPVADFTIRAVKSDDDYVIRTFMSKPIVLVFAVLLAGCDQLGIETPVQQAARSTAEGKAIGSSCRHSARALEDCYQINPKASKAAIFEGLREMDAYIRENKLETVAPQFPMNPPPSKKKLAATAAGDAPAEETKAAEAKPAEKAAH